MQAPQALQGGQTAELLTMNTYTAQLEGGQTAHGAHTCMSLAERRCRRLASCWRTTSGSAALQVTPALLVAPLLRVLELW